MFFRKIIGILKHTVWFLLRNAPHRRQVKGHHPTEVTQILSKEGKSDSAFEMSAAVPAGAGSRAAGAAAPGHWDSILPQPSGTVLTLLPRPASY